MNPCKFSENVLSPLLSIVFSHVPKHLVSDTLLKFIMSWNTNSRNCHEAQLVLNLILKMTYPDDFMKFSNAQAAVEALLPYTGGW